MPEDYTPAFIANLLIRQDAVVKSLDAQAGVQAPLLRFLAILATRAPDRWTHRVYDVFIVTRFLGGGLQTRAQWAGLFENASTDENGQTDRGNFYAIVLAVIVGRYWMDIRP